MIAMPPFLQQIVFPRWQRWDLSPVKIDYHHMLSSQFRVPFITVATPLFLQSSEGGGLAVVR